MSLKGCASAYPQDSLPFTVPADTPNAYVSVRLVSYSSMLTHESFAKSAVGRAALKQGEEAYGLVLLRCHESYR